MPPCHIKHLGIFGHYVTNHTLQADIARIAKHMAHQRQSESLSFHVGTEKDGKFATGVSRIRGGDPDDAKEIAAQRVDSNKRHLALAIKIRKVGEELRRTLPNAVKEPKTHVVRINVFTEQRVERGIVGLKRTHDHYLPAIQDESNL